MNDPLERRLRAEAATLLTAEASRAPDPRGLLEIVERRRRLSKRSRAAGRLLLGVMVAAIATAWWRSHAPSPRSSQIETVAGGAPASDRHTLSPMTVVVYDGHVRRIGVPFVVRKVDESGEEQVFTGVYVPETTEPVEWTTLSPREQNAARRVLESREDAHTI